MDNNEQKPMKVQLEQPAPKSKPKKLKPKKSLMVGLVVMGSLLVVGAIVITFMLITKNSVIGSVQELKAAIEGRRAVNCAISKDDLKLLLQTDDGWEKAKLVTDMLGQDMYLLSIKDDANYVWYPNNIRVGIKSAYDAGYFTDNIGLTDIEGITIDCKPNNQVDLAIPSDIEFSIRPNSDDSEEGE